MKKFRATIRLLYFALYTSLKIGQIVFASLIFGTNIRRSMRIRQTWARHLLPAIGVRIRSEGTPPDFPCILMSNHRSYLDPALLVCDVFAYPVSKAEVAKWPIIGYGAKVSGVLFLQRESQSSRKYTLNAIAEKLREGFPVILFPEGTTHSMSSTSPFKPGGFRMAAEAGFPIVPVALEYASVADHWIGNDTFLPHFFRRFGEKQMRVEIRYGEAIWGNDSEKLMAETQSWIDASMAEMQKNWAQEARIA